ncbi:hypothetical protein EPN90_02805 [Patescibacteria group bacterium]|nr:MAG: hypothetical protein EPN90_02805 [Patescibacteria group bacterium]
MITRVIPALRLPFNRLFDYLIPEDAPLLQPGSLVRVSFGSRRIVGLVHSVQEKSELPTSKLRPLHSALFNGNPVFTAELLELLSRLSLQYQAPLPLFLLQLLPQIPEKIGEFDSLKIGSAAGNAALSCQQVESIFNPAKITGVITEFANKRPALILVPTVAHGNWLSECLTKSGLRVASYFGELRPSTALAAWTTLAAGRADALVATRSGVFAPLPEGLPIIIFAEEEPSFIQFDAKPRYDARLLARARARAEGRELLSLAVTPTLSAWHTAQNRVLLAEPPDLTLISLAEERRGGFWGFLTERLRAAIAVSLTQRKTALVIVNRKGAATSLICRDCGQRVSCSECGSTMRVYPRELFCGRCRNKTATPTVCPSCGSARLKDNGLAISRLTAEIKKYFTAAKVVEVTGEAPGKNNINGDIIVGTEVLLHSLRPQLEKLELGAVAVPLAEQLWCGANFSDSEEGYALLRGLASLAREKKAPLILQTFIPEHEVFLALGDTPEQFYKQQLSVREEFGYPPAYLRLRLETSVSENLERVRKMLDELLPGAGRQLDQIAKNEYLLQLRSADELVPVAFQKLPKDWRWEVK